MRTRAGRGGSNGPWKEEDRRCSWVGFCCFRRESAFDAAAGLWDGGCPFISSRSSSTLFFSFGFSFLFSLITSSLSFLSGPASSLYSLHAFRLTLVLMAPLVSLAGVVQQCKT
jgi:hypothetical protein